MSDTWDPDVVPAADPVTESERAVLGSAITSPAAAAEAAETLAPHHFAVAAHQAVFEAVVRLADAGQETEPAAVLSELAAAGMLGRVGDRDLGTGGVFLHALMQRAGSVSYHAPKVLAAWQRRELTYALRSCMQIAALDTWDPGTHLDEIRRRVDAATAWAGSAGLRPQSEIVPEVLDAAERGDSPGLPTGYADLDGAIGALRPGELIVIGGRPGEGKSLLCLCIADHAATRLEFPVLYASLEMTQDELTCRRISALTQVPLTHLIRRQLDDNDWERIKRAYDRLTGSGLYVDDTPGASLARIRGRLRGMTRTGQAARLLAIDYLQLLASPEAESRQQAVAALAVGAKNLAREFAIPVLLAAQVNRNPTARTDKRPGLADLRESGMIEAAADIVLMLHNEGQDSPRAGEVDVIVAKNRQGPLCTVTMAAQGHYGRIVSMAPGDCPPDREWTPSSVIGERP